MNAIIERLGWMLLHSLWEGAVVWLLLEIILIALRKKSAQARYLAACFALAVMALLPWLTFGSMDLSARLRSAPIASVPARVHSENIPLPSSASSNAVSSSPASGSHEFFTLPVPRRTIVNAFLPWLVGAWGAGVVIFAFRLWILWRSVRRLARVPLPELSAAWQRRLGELCRTAGVHLIVRAGETAAVAVPLVIGWVKPVILLPLGVLVQLPAEQVEVILLHELAHIRRHDFLVNLLQSVVETLFFYHPAVRSISSRIREEREKVCDDLCVEWCRNPVVYAEALTTFEEFRRQSLALAITGEGDLLTRVRRIVLGIEPRQRPAGLFALAGLVAMGVYLASMFFVPLLAVELMTDQERVAKIGSLQPPHPPSFSFDLGKFVSVSGMLKTEDGQPLPRSLFVDEQRQVLNESEALLTGGDGSLSGGITVQGRSSPVFYGNTRTGKIEISVWAEGYAPCRKSIQQDHGGPLKIDLLLRCGFPGKVRITDPNGQPLDGVTLIGASSQTSGYPREVSRPRVQTDAKGLATFGHVEADSPIHLNAIKPGWQMVNQIVTNWSPQTPAQLILQPAHPTSGTVIDQVTRKPLAGAKIILAARRGAGDSYITFDPSNGQALGQSDGEGRFNLQSLAEAPGYYVYVVADGYPTQSFPIDYGQQDRVCELSPGFRVRGKILDPKGMLGSKDYYHPIQLEVMYTLQATPFNGYGADTWQAIPKLGKEISFDFEHVPAGSAALAFAIYGLEKYRYEIDVQKNIDDYVIDLGAGTPPDRDVDPRPLRTLHISLKANSDTLPTGSIDVDYLSSRDGERWGTGKTAAIREGKADLALPVPTKVDLYADDLVGYWFAPEHFDLPPGTGPVSRTVDSIRAGVLHGKINPSSAFASQTLSILPVVITPPPGLAIKDLTSGTYQRFSARNDYVTPPLPFGGTYAVVVDAAPSYFVSVPVMVDAEHPIVTSDVNLERPTGVLKGRFIDEAKKPISYQEVMLTYHPTANDSLISHCATTDAEGNFSIPAVNFNVPGNYEVQLYRDGWEKTRVRIDGHTPQPVVISLHHLAK